jgi:putative PIN family toxin of toxin-antitoxin system
MNRPPPVVLDTGVVLSALLFAGGRLAALRPGWRGGRFRPLASHETAAELIAALAYPKFKLSREDREELLADYLPYCTTVEIPDPRPRVPACRDPRDRPFLELAVAGKAGYLVTGDADLLALAGEFACPIVTPARFLEALELR